MKRIALMAVAAMLALFSTQAFAAGGACIGCVEHEMALKAGPSDGYMSALKDRYKPLVITITIIDRMTGAYTLAMGGACGGCGGHSGEGHTSSSTGGSGAATGGVHTPAHVPTAGGGGITARDILGAIGGFGGSASGDIGAGGGAISGAVDSGSDGGRTADTTTGNTGLSGGARNANGDPTGIGN